MSINDEKTGQEQRKREGIAVTPLMSICHYAENEQQKRSETPGSRHGIRHGIRCWFHNHWNN